MSYNASKQEKYPAWDLVDDAIRPSVSQWIHYENSVSHKINTVHHMCIVTLTNARTNSV